MKSFDKHRSRILNFTFHHLFISSPKKQVSSWALGRVSPEKTVHCHDWCAQLQEKRADLLCNCMARA